MDVDVEETTELMCKLGILSRSDGSAFFAEGESVVLASVYGPVEAKLQKVLIDKASVECYYRSKSAAGIQDRFRESIIRNICETALVASLHPRTAILINLQEMQNRGQLISCAVNAACLACLDAGIDMKFVFGAVSVYLTNSKKFQFIPPLSENELIAMFVFVFNNTTGSVIASHTEGSYSSEQYKTAVTLCKEESKNVFSFIKKLLISHS